MRRLLIALVLVTASTTVARGAVPCEALELQPECYVSLHPGPTRDTLSIVRIQGETVTESTGALLLTTVAVDNDLGVLQWLRGLFSTEISEVPRDLIYPSGADQREATQHNAALMHASQLDATIAALRHRDLEVDDGFDGAEVVQLSSPTAVDGDQLQPGDVIVAVDGRSTTTSGAVAAAVARHDPGGRIRLTVEGPSGRRRVAVELIENPEAPGEALLGVVLLSYLELPVDVRIDAGSIGGPSAGLMFALSIVDLLDPVDLTGGEVVAGTGTITRSGRVGPVGGIRQKFLGALSPREGPAASVFLVPRDNLPAAQQVPVEREIVLVPVDTLEQAVTGLRDLAAGRPPEGALALSPTDGPHPVRSTRP